MGDFEAGIIRSPTAEERKEFLEIGTETPTVKFLGELAKVEQKFAKEHLPFDAQCAKLDFADEVERMEKESERLFGFVSKEFVGKLKFGGLEKYGEKDRFEMVDESDVFEQQNVNGLRSQIKTGVMQSFRCKRGHGIAVFVPNEEIERRKKVK